MSGGYADNYRCGLCGGAGTFFIPARITETGGIYRYSFSPSSGILTMVEFPCTCCVGTQLRERRHWGVPEGEVRAATDAMRQYLRQSGVPEDDHPISLKEWLDGHVGEMVLIGALMNANIAVSIAMDAERRGLPAPTMPEEWTPEKSPTLARLRARAKARDKGKAMPDAPPAPKPKSGWVRAGEVLAQSPEVIAPQAHDEVTATRSADSERIEKLEREAIEAESKSVRRDIDAPW